MAFCFSGSLLRANFNIVSSCLILLLFVANKFLLLLLIAGPTVTQNLPFLPQRWPKPPPLLVAATHRRMARLSLPEWPGKYRDGRPAESCHRSQYEISLRCASYEISLRCASLKALNHLLSMPDDGSENPEALNLAVDVVGAAGDVKLTTHLMNYFLGDVDGTPKVRRQLFPYLPRNL